jgi:hypothetical protein
MADRPTPLLNPVLSLRVEPAPKAGSRGGKGRQSINVARLPEQIRVLGAASRALLGSRAQLPTFSGKTHLVARMFIDSLAPTKAPNDLFHPTQACQLVAPVKHGYLIEADVDELERLNYVIEHPSNIKVQADISNVKELGLYSTDEKLRGRDLQQMWNAALDDEEGGKLFIVWLAPFRDQAAQTALLDQVNVLADTGTIQPTFSLPPQLFPTREDAARAQPLAVSRQSSIARAMRSYRAHGAARTMIRVPSLDGLNQLVASGASYRIDPVRPIRAAQPGVGQHPDVPVDLTGAPVVGVIDGGLHAPSYTTAEAWRVTPALIPDVHADRVHGNGVTSLVVHAHAWNNNRPLPPLNCRVGTVQAVPHRNSRHPFNTTALIDHLMQVFRDHPETRVWNISANEEAPFNPNDISYLGHELTLLARQHGILPVISIGNVSPSNSDGPNAPADCEAAISVGGRIATGTGAPGDGCPRCLPGPGPDGMLKPDLSWFSELRMVGGVIDTGSSYATPLVSSVAAHTFAKLRDPSPDLVKALLINAAERDTHDPKLGWGTPFNGAAPWECHNGSVTLAWRARLTPGSAYYWNGIPIPPEMVRDGKLTGRGRLTAVLSPMVSPHASSNYFATRLQTALQYPKGKDKWDNLLGTMKESSLAETNARKELAKWQPVRRHSREFDALKFQGNHFRLFAQVFARDLYQFGRTRAEEIGPQEVAFVLTLWGADGDETIHDSTVRALGNFVESAVINQEIEIQQ